MALQILEKNGTFELCGKLNTNTSQSFVLHFQYLIRTFKNVTLNIDKVKAIDASGVEALKTLIAISIKNNSIFNIIGKGNKDIYAYNNNAFAA